MAMEQEKELLEFLGGLGAKGEKLEKELRKKLETASPGFQLQQVKNYGEEQMRYYFHFKRDLQFNAYRLEKFDAVYRKPVEIDHKVLPSGIDTLQLEEKMKTVDWEKYFNEEDREFSQSENENINDILQSLNFLHVGDKGSNGKGIRLQLQYKYWPERAWDYSVRGIKTDYEKSRTFEPNEHYICSTDLAYHTLSGRLDRLHFRLSHNKFNLYLEEMQGTALENILKKMLSDDPEIFQLTGKRNKPHGYLQYAILVQKTDGWHDIDQYSLCVTPYPPIPHGVVNGVDTEELEASMLEINWENEYRIFDKNRFSESELDVDVFYIFEQLNKLRLDQDGTKIADQLQLKYMAGSPSLKDMLPQSVWDYFDSLPKMADSFSPDTDAGVNFNLLTGKAALELKRSNYRPFEIGTWVRLDLSRKDEDGHYPIIRIKGFTEKALRKALEGLPISFPETSLLLQHLELGNGSYKEINGKIVHIEANPEEKTINISSLDGRPIYSNLLLDPDWKHPLSESETKQAMGGKVGHIWRQYPKPMPGKRNRHRSQGL